MIEEAPARLQFHQEVEVALRPGLSPGDRSEDPQVCCPVPPGYCENPGPLFPDLIERDGHRCSMHSIGSRGYEFASPGCIVEKNRLPESGWLCGVNSAGTDIRVGLARCSRGARPCLGPARSVPVSR